MSFWTFIARLRHDGRLRDRFLRNPKAVLREFNVDPAPYEVPEQPTEAQLNHLIADWSKPPAPPTDPLPPKPPPAPAPTPVYGPPPGFFKRPA